MTTASTPEAAESAPSRPVIGAPSQDVLRLMRMADLVTPMAIRVAATLRLVDLVQEGVTEVSALAARTQTNPDALSRLVRHLAAVGLLETTPGGGLRPTELGLLLAEEHPARQRAFHDLGLAVGRADLGIPFLLEAVRTGRSVHELAHGSGFWDDLLVSEELSDSVFNLLFAGREPFWNAAADAYDWSSMRHLLDLGCGNGGQLAALLRVAPDARATLLDLARPLAGARRTMQAAGLADRCTFVEGSFFDELPVRADGIVLGMVLHAWPDGDAVAILRRCRAALEPGGRIVLVEKAVDAAATEPRFTSMDLRMLVYVGGRERTADEWGVLAARAGLRVESVSPPFGFDTSVLSLVPADDASDNGSGPFGLDKPGSA